MRVSVALRVIVVGLAITVAGCASPPNADMDAAKAAIDKAVSDNAGRYAADSLKVAQDAWAALDAELKAQEGKWFKSYDKAKELAVAAKAAGDKASADAIAGKAQADAVALKEKADAEAREKARAAAVRVGGKIKAPKKIKDVAPVYPAAAKSAGVQGAVIVEATIGADGKVQDARILRSVPQLNQAALDAVQQWEFTPTRLNGVPVPVVMTVTVNFKLK